MGRQPCCDKHGVKKGPWNPEEDEILVNYINKNGHGSWRTLPQLAGLNRCGKSCRLRWSNYLRPDIKRGPFTPEEEKLIIQLHGILGNRWAAIAAKLEGRTDNEIKNYFNTHVKKRLRIMAIDPLTQAPSSSVYFPITTTSSCPSMGHMTQWESARLEAEARLSKGSVLCNNSQSTLSTQVKPEPDQYLRLWNSEVGESFRKLTTTCQSPNSSQSPNSQTSSSSKQALTPAKIKTEEKTINEQQEEMECRDSKSDVEDIVVGSESSSSMNVSSDMSLQLLLDFPGCEEEMTFFQGQLATYSVYHEILTENTLNCSL
ncbi:hypothetical protein MKW92_024749 [Papaver armeniacum]|nr:hypothetical protein MKW92_024749 [Papaver armeniacum]